MSDFIEFKNWPEDRTWSLLSLAKTEYRKMRMAYFRLMETGEKAIKTLKKEGKQ
jgi:hypothetical protein